MMRLPDRLRVGIVYDDTLDRPGGVASYCRTLARELAKRGHLPEFLVGTATADMCDGLPVHALSHNVRVNFNGNQFTSPAIPRIRSIRQLMAHTHYDVLHIQAPFSPLMAQLVIKSAPPDTAVVATFHVYSERMTVKLGAQVLSWLCAPGIRRIDHVLAVSDPAARFARRHMGLKASVVPNLVDLDSSRGGEHQARTDDTPKTSFHVVFVGALVQRKGAVELLHAFVLVRRQLPNALLTIAGDGPLRPRLEAMASSLGLSGAVTFVGQVSDTERSRLLQVADVACFPSIFGESFGIVLLEGVAHGAGVVLAGRNAGYRSTLGGLTARSTIEPKAPEAFAARLVELLTDFHARTTLAAAQRELVEKFDARVVTDQVLDAYAAAIHRLQRLERRPEHHASSD